jgi:hypothetical protein
VTVIFTCGDSLSGIANCPGPVLVNTEGAGQIITGSARDRAGNSASAAVKLNIDKTPPVIAASASPPPNSARWNNTDVTVAFQCSDTGSGIAKCAAPQLVSKEGANQIISGSATDIAGNSASASVTLNVEKTPPSITASIMPQPNAAGWNNIDVTASFQCGNSLSGGIQCPSPQLVSTEGVNQSRSGTVTDIAGNSATATANINLDKTPPVLTITSPADGSTSSISTISVTGNASDALSGIATANCKGVAALFQGSSFNCSVTLNPGPTTITVIATDAAGNSTSSSVSVSYGSVIGTPDLIKVDPNAGVQGQQNLSVALTGDFTHWLQGTSRADFGAGITVASVAVNSPTSATAVVNIGGEPAVVLPPASRGQAAPGYAATDFATGFANNGAGRQLAWPLTRQATCSSCSIQLASYISSARPVAQPLQPRG